MRRDNHPLKLFLGYVGECKNRPVTLVVGRAGLHLDTAANAIAAGRSRNLKGFALIGVDIRGRRQVQSAVVAGNLHRLKGEDWETGSTVTMMASRSPSARDSHAAMKRSS